MVLFITLNAFNFLNIKIISVSPSLVFMWGNRGVNLHVGLEVRLVLDQLWLKARPISWGQPMKLIRGVVKATRGDQ